MSSPRGSVLAEWPEADDSLPRQARRHLLAALEHQGVSSVAIDDAALMGSELVTNAIRHGNSPVALLLWRSPLGCIVVEVHDTATQRPVLPVPDTAADLDAEGNRGLFLVTRFSDGLCGVEPTARGGKSVWFALPLRTSTPAQRVLSAQVNTRNNPPRAMAAWRTDRRTLTTAGTPRTRLA